ncbi:hypothetical protein ABIE78_003832 [Sinorhizobium fredii]|uniref:Uncharacterized protein n=1 Tax=Sinorhizobium fredii (strain USDA 257) TaxID=1185652 RepID=I3X3B4_SINF2|nr:hypothetical protein USDA257_c17820 [Sinorhizobium fredii USDA 257]
MNQIANEYIINQPIGLRRVSTLRRITSVKSNAEGRSVKG